MIISPEHAKLDAKYRELVLKHHQQELVLASKDEEYKLLKSKFTPLTNQVTKLTEGYKQLQLENVQLHKVIKEQSQALQKLEIMQFQFEQLQRMVYARSSERSSGVDSGQLSLGMEADVVDACLISDGQRVSGYTKQKAEQKPHPGRNAIPAHVDRHIIDMYPDNVPEGAVLVDTIDSEQLEYDPAKLFATVYRRYKYKLDKEDGTTEFFIASLPDEKDKSMAAPSLKAHMTTEKYLWHTPLHRQQQKFASLGIILNENTIGDWVNGVCSSLTALYDEHRKAIVHPACGYMMADETHMTVLASERMKGKKAHIGYMWAYCNPVDRLVFFEYQKGRGNKHAREVLQHYQGYLHTDGYNVYKHYGNLPGVTHVNCNAHARRKFHEAKFTDKKRGEHALMLYSQLYGVESYCKEMELSFDERLKIRQEKSVPVFKELCEWVREELPKVTTLRSPIGKALAYFSEREKQLGMYLTDGMLLMDTNIIENTIRPIALGRNNYMFCGSHEAAQNAAMIYSLLATCRLHNVNGYEWLKYVITVMPTFPSSRIKELLPQNWKGLDPVI